MISTHAYYIRGLKNLGSILMPVSGLTSMVLVLYSVPSVCIGQHW